ncbi:MAG: DUF2461 domain-containing protein [Pseudomonadota bacterium]
MSGFKGFPKEMVRFFDLLEKNNNRAWFEEHKRDYEEDVKYPAMAFVMAMGGRLKKIAPRVNAIPQVNQSLFRINRDTRFSPDKRPYKTHLGIWFWEGERKRMECSGFYFHVGEGRLLLGTGMHVFPRAFLDPYREAVVDKKLGPLLSRTLSGISKKGYRVTGNQYKQVPRGYDPDHINSDYLLHNGLAALFETKIPEELFSEAIVDYAFSHFENMSLLHEWLKKALQ